MADEIMTLYDEDGNGINFEFLDYIELKDQKYVALLPLEGDPNQQEVLFLQVIEAKDGSQDFSVVESKKLADRLYRQFKEDHKDEFEFRD